MTVRNETTTITNYFRRTPGIGWVICYDGDVEDALEKGWEVKRSTITRIIEEELLEPKEAE